MYNWLFLTTEKPHVPEFKVNGQISNFPKIDVKTLKIHRLILLLFYPFAWRLNTLTHPNSNSTVKFLKSTCRPSSVHLRNFSCQICIQQAPNRLKVISGHFYFLENFRFFFSPIGIFQKIVNRIENNNFFWVSGIWVL